MQPTDRRQLTRWLARLEELAKEANALIHSAQMLLIDSECDDRPGPPRPRAEAIAVLNNHRHRTPTQKETTHHARQTI